MPKIISWKLFFLIILLIILSAMYLRTPKPCQETITYRLGKVDDRFGLTRQEFAFAIKMAAEMWGKPLGRNIFQEDSRGAIEINLVYDYRQEASDKLKKLNYKIDNTKTSYDDLKARLESLKAQYDQSSAVLTNDLDMYNSRINTFNKNVEYWNRHGGIMESVHKNLLQEKDELNYLQEKLKVRQDDLRQLTDTINNMVVVINEIATNINLDLVNYQNTGDSLGREFCEGFYENKNGEQTINIYQFDNNKRLIRVLAHELGHALRLNHSADPSAVMYRLMQSDAIELSPDDVSALQHRCNN
jgi:chromosome segregation ATPase